MTEAQLYVMPLARYYKTDHWAAVKCAVFQRDGGRCVLCNRSAAQAHHRSYANRGNFDLEVNDVHSLCCRCHDLFHKTAKIAKKNHTWTEYDENTGVNQS